eukprot:TRINITY_DN23340_c0_g1_i2.p1 TRINITY_DN23340_c0_g1~~TRINITY_DN23340_c0_g1_i2.p1  ORF type:complete len:274 (-),score=68.00 TRINITY_DN23340_c0_g1_i2:143-964(-)
MTKVELQRRRRKHSYSAPLLVLVSLAAAAGLASVNAGTGAVGNIMSSVDSSLRPFREEIASGHIIPKFGEKSDVVLRNAVSQAGSAGAVIERAVDGMLQSLFLQQLALLRQETASKTSSSSARPIEAVTLADKQFVSQAEELKRPGSAWSYDQERYALRAVLESGYRRQVALAEERAHAAYTQAATVEIISKLQSQMESLQQKVHQMRAGSPMFFSSSYRIPHTPVQLIGRLQQGRPSLEISLRDDRDPINAEAGFVQGVGPANLGITGNVGM